MKLAGKIGKTDGIIQISVGMGTPLNKDTMNDLGLLLEDGRAASANDLIIAIEAASEEIAAEAKEAYTCFSDFQKTGLDRDYWSGVASFYAFQRAYGLLTDGTNKSANAIFCNEVYGSLLMAPEQAKAHISEIADTMKLLSENVTDENAYLRMAALRNTLNR